MNPSFFPITESEPSPVITWSIRIVSTGTEASMTVEYQPGESTSGLFGGNSNWRGPIWFPVNFLIIESLQKFYHYYGDEFKIECPTGSGRYYNDQGSC